MKKLEDYSISELKNAIYKKELEEAEIKSTTLPTNYYPYSKTEIIDNFDIAYEMNKFFYCHVNDGSEGYEYLVQVTTGAFGGGMEEKIKNSVIHNHITEATDDDWNSYFEDVTIEEFGRYGMKFLKIDIRSEQEDDD